MSELDSIDERLGIVWHGPSWHGPALWKTLEGITTKEAAMRHVPRAHTIWEIVQHLMAWREAAIRGVREGVVAVAGKDNFPGPTDASDVDWSHTITGLEKSEERLLDCVRSLQDADLDRIVQAGPESYSIRFLLNGVVHHDLYHAGQIMILRKHPV